MNTESKYIEHAGLVTEAQPDRIKISLVGSGCSGCHDSLCLLGGSKARELEIAISKSQFQAGDEVIVKINPALGYKALTLLYLVTFVLIMITLMIMSAADYPEGIAGLTSMIILVPYYGLLYLLRSQLRSQCNMDVEKR